MNTEEIKDVTVIRITVYHNGNKVIKQFFNNVDKATNFVNYLTNALHCVEDNGYYIDLSTFEAPEDMVKYLMSFVSNDEEDYE